MLNLVQHLTKSGTYETLKQVQGDESGLFTKPSNYNFDCSPPPGCGFMEMADSPRHDFSIL